ncbi:hypothetical protein LOK49_Contig327G00007 [Camellia lanceoleosa]|nr:hypothetical protein LOK49_Contig327G00007 [Camellia lanceoleosa]
MMFKIKMTNLSSKKYFFKLLVRGKIVIYSCWSYTAGCAV